MKDRKPLTIKNGYAFFWKQWPSNWEHSPFKIDNIQYNCVEQYMMAEKARLFNDNETLNKILATENPREQKALGRKVKNFTDKEWNKVRFDVVLKATLEKYRQNPKLQELLLAIGDLYFVEASPMDKVWGIGMSETDPNICDKNNWKGLNLLGQVINKARDILRKEYGK